jgi:hypothetical protein
MRTKLWVAAIAMLISSSAAALAQRGGQASISGRWEGEWKNSHGSEGYDVLEIDESPSGEIYGTWGTRGYQVAGRRVGSNRYVWEAHGRGRHYEATARLGRGGRLRVDYTATYREGGEIRTYRGWSELLRTEW